MPGYTIAIQKDSPVYKLYQKLKADGVKDADLDTGYPETDYVNKTRTIVHKGDHKIEAAEVLDYALEHYERYQLAIQEAAGFEIPWALESPGYVFKFDSDIRAKIDQAITKFKQLLAAKGPKAGTARYNELLAAALYAFVMSSQSVSDKIKQELSKEGLSGVADYLAKNGGLAVGEFKGDCAREATAIGALMDGCGACTEKSEILYAVLRRAGLGGKYLYVTLGYTASKKLRVQLGMEHMSVSVKLGERTRIFDPAMNESNAEPFYIKNGFAWWFEQTGREFLASSMINLGAAYAKNLDRPDLALEAYKIAVRLDPGSVEVHFNIGHVYVQRGEWDRAIPEFMTVLKLNPNSAEARELLGYIYDEKGDQDRAIEECTAAGKIAPDLPEVYGCTGRASARKGMKLEKAGKNQEALELYRRSWQDFKRAEALGARVTPESYDFLQKKIGLPGTKD